MIIYKITNTVNGKIYVGQTRQPLKKRWMQHCYSRCNSRGLLGAIQKYGKDSFTVEVLVDAKSKQELDEQEKHFIAFFTPSLI